MAFALNPQLINTGFLGQVGTAPQIEGQQRHGFRSYQTNNE